MLCRGTDASSRDYPWRWWDCQLKALRYYLVAPCALACASSEPILPEGSWGIAYMQNKCCSVLLKGFCHLVFIYAMSAAHAQTADIRPVILAVGESTTAGFGVPPDKSYPAQLQQLLDEAGY